MLNTAQEIYTKVVRTLSAPERLRTGLSYS